MFESNIFSKKICQLCSRDLEVFSQFRKDLSRKQAELYRKLQEKKPEFAQDIFNDVKSEVNEFIDCEVQEDENECFDPQVVIKSETRDEVFEEFADPVEKIKSCKKENFKREKIVKETEHTSEYLDDNLVVCDVCGFLSSKSRMEIHMKNHSLKEAQSFYCEFCSKEFDKVTKSLH